MQNATILLIDGVSRELVEKANCGVYVEPENPSEFAKIIEQYNSKGKQLINELGNNGYVYAKLHFDREILANRYLVELENVAKR